MKARFVVISVIAVVLVVGLYGIDINDDPAPATHDQPLKKSDHTIVKSETLSVVTGVHYVDSQSMQSSFEHHDIPVDELQTDKRAFSFVQNADAISAEQSEISITRHEIGFKGNAFASNGDVYGGDRNKIYMADISEGIKTTWIIPDGHTISDSWRGYRSISSVVHDLPRHGDVDSSGSYYFSSEDGLYRINSTSNLFTTWSWIQLADNTVVGMGSPPLSLQDGIQLADNTVFVDSHDNVWFESQYGGDYHIGDWSQNIDSINILEGNSQLDVLVTHIETVVYTDSNEEYSNCRNACSDNENVCTQPCDDAYDQCSEGIDRCSEINAACEQPCEEDRDLCWDACENEHRFTVDEDNYVNKLIRFRATGVSFPATVKLLDSNENVLEMGALYPNSDAQIHGHFSLPTNITSGTYNTTSSTWDIPAGNYNITGTYKISIHDLSQTAHATFNLDPDMVVPPESVPTDMAEPKSLASFVDPEINPQHYVDRYLNEAAYKKWFDDGYPQYSSIYEAVGLPVPADMPAPARYHTNPHYQFVSKLDPATNTITRFYAPSLANTDLIAMDSSDSLYFRQDNTVIKFASGSDEITRWHFPTTIPYAIGTFDQKIYTITDHRNPTSLEYFQKISELDTATGILREWIMPESSHNPNVIIVDDQGNVFFNGCKNGCGVYRFVPSTETFTRFAGNGDYHSFLKDGANGAIYWAATGRHAGTIR